MSFRESRKSQKFATYFCGELSLRQQTSSRFLSRLLSRKRINLHSPRSRARARSFHSSGSSRAVYGKLSLPFFSLLFPARFMKPRLHVCTPAGLFNWINAPLRKTTNFPASPQRGVRNYESYTVCQLFRIFFAAVKRHFSVSAPSRFLLKCTDFCMHAELCRRRSQQRGTRYLSSTYFPACAQWASNVLRAGEYSLGTGL